jgi:hypothetical protein
VNWVDSLNLKLFSYGTGRSGEKINDFIDVTCSEMFFRIKKETKLYRHSMTSGAIWYSWNDTASLDVPVTTFF